YLEGPDGSRIMIFNRAGGLSADLRDTRFSDQASQGIGTGKGPFTGAYRPHAALSAFRGKLTQGTWKLIVEDTMGQAPATLLNWSLYVQPVG
ncbi:MAG: proprotein convertase P-domain-containing protein, partial [Gemmataceae bacterium]